MDLQLVRETAATYTSGSQIARKLSESWAARNLYCAACSNDGLRATKANTPAVDFSCPRCDQDYQLKSGKGWSERRVPDAAYDKMIAAIRSDRVPNLLVLQYSPDHWTVRNLLLVPHFFFTESAIQCRKALSATARRRGWVGCDILLTEIPAEGRIHLVRDGRAEAPAGVRSRFESLRALSELKPEARGWTLDVLKFVRRLGEEFTLSQVYAFEPELQAMHPRNRHVKDKIRQQLQVLRDLDQVEFLDRGHYRAKPAL